MARSAFPRARGGRGPQIGPGTFLGRVAPTGVKPPIFSHLAWSQGVSTPDVEMWCFLVRDVGSALKYEPINPVLPNHHIAWLDQVVEAEAFNPPASGPLPTLLFRQYAAELMMLKHDTATQVSDWVVRVARPFPFAGAPDSDRRFGSGVFEVRQSDLSNTPVAWLWVTRDFAREIWIHWRPGEPGGFAFVGRPLPGTEQPYLSTELRFVRVLDDLEPSLSVQYYGASILALEEAILERPMCPAANTNELEVHDYRIGPDSF